MMYKREPWENLSTGVKLAVIGLFALLLAVDLGAVALGYLFDGWRGAAILGVIVIVQMEFRIFRRNPS
jgi:hypothetical protein